MRSNRLQLNTAKTEILWSATSRRLHQLPQSPLRAGRAISTISCLPLSFEISGSTLTPTSRCELMLQEECRPVLRCCVNYGASAVSVEARSPVARVVTCFVSTGLRQLDPPRTSSAAPIRDKCSCSADFSVVEIRPRHTGSSSTPLTEGSRTD